MSQLSLDLEPPAVSRPPALLEAARAEGDRLGNLAADKAEQAEPEFRDLAKAFILKYLETHGVSSSELLTDACKLAGIKPPDDRAFGPVYAALSRDNQIAFAGFCERRKGHGTAGGRLWRRVR